MNAKSPDSRRNINNVCHLEDCDAEKLKVVGYEEDSRKKFLFIVLSIATLGLLPLICHWKRETYLYLTQKACELSKCSSVLVESSEGKYVHKVVCIKLDASQLNDIEYISKYLNDGVCRYFTHRQLRFYWSESLYSFFPDTGLDQSLTLSQIYKQTSGLSEGERSERLKVFGNNIIEVIIKPFIQIFLEGLVDPFYIIQILAVIVWFWDEYEYFASAISVILVFSLITSTYHERKNLKHLRDMVYLSTKINVLYDGEISEKLSSTLVPGDIIVLKDPDFVVPCDFALLSGTCIVNESMLTGESFPTTKVPVEILIGSEESIFNKKDHSKSILYCGTYVSQIRSYKDSLVLGLVLSTGFTTLKGSMIRSVIYPKSIKFTFFRDSIRFLIILAIISLGGVGYSVYQFIRAGSSASLIIRKALDIIFIIIPPTLPAALTLSTAYSMNRLRSLKITCIESSRINICGKLKLICFDKTGTLTEEGINMYGALACKDGVFDQSLIEDVSEIEGDHLHKCMTCCHSLTKINGHIVGDPLEYVIFKNTNWEFIDPQEMEAGNSDSFNTISPGIVKPTRPSGTGGIDQQIGIIRVFQFQSELQRMSSIVRTFHNNEFICYTKGAPEVIAKMCIPSSVPADFPEVLYNYTNMGYRVLGAAYKTMDNFSWHKAQKITRKDVECDLTFIGLFVLKNKLKPNSKDVIRSLKFAGIRTLMVTGDNLLTAISVASECGILYPHKDLIKLNVSNHASLADINSFTHENEGEKLSKVFQLDSSSASIFIAEKLISHKFLDQDENPKASTVCSNPTSLLSSQLVVEGDCFSFIRQNEPELYKKLLVSGCVFARMSPGFKTQLVEDLREIGYTVGMCGDGANDCGALKAAHAGIALAASEASVVAPFSSSSTCPSCVLMLLAEGRSSLVTAFSMFKYIILYSITQFTSTMFLYSYQTNLSDFDFLFVDLLLTAPLIATMIRSRPSYKLSQDRPLGRLVHPLIFFSLFGHFFIQVILHIVVLHLLQNQNWYIPNVHFDPDHLDYRVQPSTVIFFATNFVYLYHSIAVNIGPPYRELFFYNNSYLSALLLLFVTCIMIVAAPGHHLVKLFEISDIPYLGFRAIIMGLAISFGLVSILFEYSVNSVDSFKKLINLLRFKNKPRNSYKSIVADLSNNDIFKVE